ncbi:hypothetical protein B0T25DRAFT_449147 [Lasiosphaeria hispida]|uniref:NmrA-like domain-containing protein n=1 Tax=Lasiosphaeria hispida TaxID=260671 RepID=A0AAJ0HNZ6_9PEZI|nr:hypothetical protein B0T25DRAFT_449147 [Lasiosphaeria hispida]
MASFAPSKILVIGGTGIIGKYITASLLRAKPAFDQVILFTSANTVATKGELLEKWKSEGLSIIVGNFESDSDVAAAFAGVDTVISALGRSVLHHQIRLLQLAEDSGTVQWFLPSEFGTDIEHNDKSPNEPPHQNKLKVRKYVREHIKRLKVTYVVTGPYFDMWVNTQPGVEITGGFVPDKKEAYLIDDGNTKVGFCTMWDVGKFVVATLRNPQESFGKALKVQSFVVTPNEVLAEYEKQTGSEWKVTRTSLTDIRNLEAKLLAEGKPASISLRRIWAEGGTLYAKNDNELLGLGPEDLDSLEVGVKKALAGGWKKDTF